MSTQKGNASRTRSQKHKNIKAFKNDLHDTSHITKKINNLEFYGLCEKCKDVIDWKVKYKKYKPLSVPKKCVKCLEKKVKNAYYIVCLDCCTSLQVCSKCSKPCEELEFGESEAEKHRKEQEFQCKLKQLSERQRRKFLRLLEKGAFTKENLLDDAEQFKNENDSDIMFSDEDDDEEDFDDEDEFDSQEEEEEEEEENEELDKHLSKKLHLKDRNNNDKESDDDDEDEYDTDEENDYDDDDDDDYSEQDTDEDDEYETLSDDEEDEEEEIEPESEKKAARKQIISKPRLKFNKKK